MAGKKKNKLTKAEQKWVVKKLLCFAKPFMPLFIIAFEDNILIIVLQATDFPEPDSPTIANVSPLCKSNVTPLTA